MELLFFLTGILLAYFYIGYYIILCLLSLFINKRYLAQVKYFYPEISIIIPAYNERGKIAEKIRNTLLLEYPQDKIEIIIVSDASNDGTDEIISSFKDEKLTFLRKKEREGKESAQKMGIDHAKGKIIIFSDVSTMVGHDTAKRIVKNFHDPVIGCVSSIDKLVSQDGRISGEGLYVRYEMAIRRLESKVNSLVGLSGSFFAVRKELCDPWPKDLASDFNVVFNAIRAGKKAILDESVIGFYKDIPDEKREFERKVRTVIRGITVLSKNLDMLNPFRYRLFSWQLFSHKLLRWISPFLLILFFLSNLAIAYDKTFFIIFLGQSVIWLLIITSALAPQKISPFKRLATYFINVNLSIIIAWWRFVRGERISMWRPSQRD